MKYINKILLFILLILSISSNGQNQQVVTFISPRSQSFNAERMLSGWENSIHLPNKKNDFYGTFAFTVEGTSSFRTERINQCLFGEDIVQCPQNNTEWTDFIFISGSQTSNRIPQKDWFADYFGLSPNFKSIVKFRPRVNNCIIDMHTFIGLNNITPGLYLRIELPLVYANWHLNMKECIQNEPTIGYSPGYFNASGIDVTKLMPSFSEFVAGFSSPNVSDLIFQPLRYAKMSPFSHSLIRCAELTTTLGYDYFIGKYHHLGIAFQAAAPCGNKPKATYLFEPIIGNGHHWECGGELSAHCRTWTHETEDIFTEFFFDATVTHLFKSRQKRSFDLHNNPNSRYMLAEKLTQPVRDNLNGNGTPAHAQYAQEVSPIANISTFAIDVTISAQADIAFMYAYTRHQNTWSIGYSLWKRACEHIHLVNCNDFPSQTWAIKGDAYMFGFATEPLTSTDLPIGTAVQLSATEQKATINSGTNFPSTGITNNTEIINAQRNPHIDFPQPAFAGNQPLAASLDDISITNQINTSIQPRFITLEDIDLNSAATSGFSQKFFTHFNHKITTSSPTLEAYFGIGAEIEFGRQAGPTPPINEDKCINCALSYWGSWVKTGFTW